MKKFSILIFISLLLILGVSCQKDTKKPEHIQNKKPAKKPAEVTTIDKALKQAMVHLNLAPEDCGYAKRDSVIYYYLPVNPDSIELSIADMLVSGQLEMIGINMTKIIFDDDNKISKEYFDPIHKQKYIIEIRYQKIHKHIKKTSKIQYSIIIDDFGYIQGNLLSKFSELNSKITFAILPFLPNSRKSLIVASESGHAALIHMPMEPLDYPTQNPGPGAILTTMTEKQVLQQLISAFSQLPGVIGLNNHMGSKATENEKIMKSVCSFLQNKNLILVDSKTSSSNLAQHMASNYKITYLSRDIFLDVPNTSNKTTKAVIQKMLTGAKQKYLIITHCHDKAHFQQIQYFVQQADDAGFKMISLSEFKKVANSPIA